MSIRSQISLEQSRQVCMLILYNYKFIFPLYFSAYYNAPNKHSWETHSYHRLANRLSKNVYALQNHILIISILRYIINVYNRRSHFSLANRLIVAPFFLSSPYSFLLIFVLPQFLPLFTYDQLAYLPAQPSLLFIRGKVFLSIYETSYYPCVMQWIKNP